MSATSASAGPSTPLLKKNLRKAKRNLRNATFIIPSTRERAKRQFTLRNPSNFDGPARQNSDDSLLPFHRNLTPGKLEIGYHYAKVKGKRLWQWLHTRNGRGVLKCSIAYLLACMGTYLPFLSSWLGKGDGKHMVATIVVYFHPGRSAGSMIEAAILGVLAFLYATFVSISSMAVSVLCESQLGLIELGYTIVLVVFVGGGLGFVGWTKQKLGSPLVNVACSLASLAIITVLTKENAVQTAVFSDDKIFQVMKMLLLAMSISTAVSLLVWPISARRDLRQSMLDATANIGEMLTTITRSFLEGTDDDLKSPAFESSIKRYKASFIGLAKNLKEAKAEHYVLGSENRYHREATIVNCIQRLATDVGGLRSAAMTQFTLLEEIAVMGNTTPSTTMPPYLSTPQFFVGSIPSTVRARQERFGSLTAIDEASEEGSDLGDLPEPISFERRGTEESDTINLPTIRTPSEIFARFMKHLGPSMKSLVFTLQQILQDLPFGPGPKFKIAINDNFKISLVDALELYRGARADALEHLYRNKDLGGERLESVEADFEEVAASCGHYSFCLQDFAEEIIKYLEMLEDLKAHLEAPRQRSWSWLKFWRRKNSEKQNASELPTPAEPSRGFVLSKDVPLVPKLKIRKPNPDLTAKQKVYRNIFKVLNFFNREDILFAVKVGTGAALFASLAFIPGTRPYYTHWRGEWGLLSYMLVCSMTIGASNTTGFARIIGTVLGAVLSIIAWLSCQGNPWALAFCGWLASLYCFYLIVAAGKAPLGRFILLTYNISALYAYTLSVRQGEDDEDEGGVNPIIAEIALHRVVAVVTGCLWGLFITRIIWPISARQKFKEGLAVLWLRMGLIWKRDPLSTTLHGDFNGTYMNMQEEFTLQTYVARLETLRTASASEFSLRGPFPQKSFSRIMDSTNKMLDAFHAMNVVISQNQVLTPGEIALLKFTAEERAQLCIRICHLFQVLASSMKLEYPLTDTLPGTGRTRDRLLARIFGFRRRQLGRVGVGNGNGNGNANANGMVLGEESAIGSREGEAAAEAEEGVKDEDYALLYAYALVTGQLAEEILKVEKEIEGLFGVVDEKGW